MGKKRIKLIATGGTISALSNSSVDLKDYKSGLLTSEELINSLPDIDNVEVDTLQLENFSSTLMSEREWIKLRDLIHNYLNNEAYDGVVITHGTNTLEETAYFLHLTVKTKKPIVLVGSQRPFSSISSDAHLNLYNAIQVAANEESSGKGVLVVLNDVISSAREVRKTDTYRLETFQSGEFGILGYVDPDKTVQYYRQPTRKHTHSSVFSNIKIDSLPKVEIVYSYAGSDGQLIRYITDSKNYDGIVMAGTGAGRFSKKEEAALDEATKEGIAVVRSSRVGNGRVVNIEHYNKYKFIAADNLLPQKARILLMLILLVDKDLSNYDYYFATY